MSQINKNMLSYLSLASLALMFCLPFMVAYHKWPEPNYYSQLLALFLGVVSLIVFFKPYANKLSVPLSILVPAGLSLLLVVQWFSGIGAYWQETMLAVLYLWWGVLLMLIVARLKAVYGLSALVRWFAYALLIGGLFNVLVVMMQLMRVDHFFWTFPTVGKSYTGNLAQVNHLTNYVSLALISLVYLHLIGRIKGKLGLFLLILFLMALSLTGSRMSWLYVLMITVSFFVFGRKSEHQGWKAKSTIILALPVLYGLVQLVLPFVLDIVTQSQVALPSMPAERIANFSGQHSTRLDLIKEGLDIFSDHPWLGVGWGQYVWYDLIYAGVHANHQGFITHTHNLFVQILAECGIFAGLLLLSGTIYWFAQLIKQKPSIERWWLMLIVGILFTHSLLEYPLWYAYFLGVFCVVIALGDKCVELKMFKPVVPSVIAAVVCTVSLNLLFVTTQQYKQIEYWINVYPQLNKEQRLTMLNELSGIYPKTLIAEPLHMVLTRAYSVLPSKRAPLKIKIARYEAVMHYVQAEQDIYRYIFLLAADGQTEKAITFLKRAYTRQPAYIHQFEKQLAEGVRRGNSSFIAVQAEVQQLQKLNKH